MSLALTSLKREIKIDDSHIVNTNCDFSKAVYIGGNIEKYAETSFPSWIHEIVNADITNKTIHQCEYFKFMKLGKLKRKEFIEFIRNIEIPSAMIHVDTNEPLNENHNAVFITTDQELKHLSIDESILGLNIQVTGKLMLYNNHIKEKLKYVRYVINQPFHITLTTQILKLFLLSKGQSKLAIMDFVIIGGKEFKFLAHCQ